MKFSLPVLIFLSFFSMPLSAQTKSFEIQGHRGCRGLRPENSIPAFQHAISLGIKTLEMDVVISKDHQVVVSHEPYFHPDISTDPNGNPVTRPVPMYQLPYSVIQTYDVGIRGNPRFPEQKPVPTVKPLLSDVLHQTSSTGVVYSIEIKSVSSEVGTSQPDIPTFCTLVATVWKSSGIPDSQLVIQSFDAEVLKYWYEGKKNGFLPKATLAWLIEPEDDNSLELQWKRLGFLPDIWSPHYSQVTQDRVKICHQLGLRVIPWTVNQPQDMERIQKLGCDGLITDYPDRAKALGYF